MRTKNQSSQGAGTSTSRTTESRQWQQTTDYLTDRQAGRQTFGENKPNGWIAILAAFAFRYFPISSNNRNRAKPYRKFCEFLLNSCGKSHPLAHKFHAQLAISFGFSFFFHFFAAWALKRFVLFSCTCLLRLCCENRKKKREKWQQQQRQQQCTNPACGSHFWSSTPCQQHTWKLTYFAALGDLLVFLCRAKGKCKFTLDASKFK